VKENKNICRHLEHVVDKRDSYLQERWRGLRANLIKEYDCVVKVQIDLLKL